MLYCIKINFELLCNSDVSRWHHLILDINRDNKTEDNLNDFILSPWLIVQKYSKIKNHLTCDHTTEEVLTTNFKNSNPYT